MSQRLRFSSYDEFAEFYSELCDVIFRQDWNTPAGDGLHHTSDVARRKAMDIVDRLVATNYMAPIPVQKSESDENDLHRAPKKRK